MTSRVILLAAWAAIVLSLVLGIITTAFDKALPVRPVTPPAAEPDAQPVAAPTLAEDATERAVAVSLEAAPQLVGWGASPGTPLAAWPESKQPTWEGLTRYFVGRCGKPLVSSDADLWAIWIECSQHWCLRQRVLAYTDEEREAWEQGQQIEPLLGQLHPVATWVQAELGAEVWDAAAAYERASYDARTTGDWRAADAASEALFTLMLEAECFERLHERIDELCEN